MSIALAYQFVHLATFSRKGNCVGRSVIDIAGEAARLDGQAPHVANPGPPTVLAGISPASIPDEIDARVKVAKLALRGTGSAAIRQDTHILEGLVMSYPAYTQPDPIGRTSLAMPEVRSAYLAWRRDTVQWVRRDAQKRGLEILSIVEHLDEQHPHIHVLSVPTNRRLDAKASHPGYAAKGVALAAGMPPKEANRAYKAAMRAWQDEYHASVGMPHGLTRIGPSRRRLTRAEWRAEQAEAARVAQRQRDLLVAERVAADKLAHARQVEIEVVAKIAAIITAAKAWAVGLLWRRGAEMDSSGEPTLIVNGRHPEDGKALMCQLDGHRHMVADLLDQLPDREMIQEVSDLAAELGPHMELAKRSKVSAWQSVARRLTFTDAKSGIESPPQRSR